MTTATYTQPTTRSSSNTRLLPLFGVALGLAGVTLSVVALTNDDVAEVVERTVVVETPADEATSATPLESPVATVDPTDDRFALCGPVRVLEVHRC